MIGSEKDLYPNGNGGSFGARGHGSPLQYSDTGFQSSNTVGVKDDSKGATWLSPSGAKSGQNAKGAVPSLTGNRGGKVPASLSTQQHGLRTGAGHDDDLPRRSNS